ncbi:hypothetical protein D9M68_19280 [compost metagenome]
MADEIIILYEGDEEPIQPVYLDANGHIRFLENRIVRDLLDFASGYRYDLNWIACQGYTAEEHRQFAQLIGYSVSGYGDLSYVDRRACDRADHLAHQLTLEFDLKF